MDDELIKHVKELKQKTFEEFYERSRSAFHNAGAMFDVAVNEFFRSRYEAAAKAAIMSIKMYAAAKIVKGIAQETFNKSKQFLDSLYGELIINGKNYVPDIVDRLSRTKSGFNAALIGAASSSMYLLLGSCYYSFRATQFLAYNFPFSWLINTRKNWEAGEMIEPDFTSAPEVSRLIHAVGYIMATMNCPEAFPDPWTDEEKELELRAPLDWNIF